jgi:hypothetical protein
MDRLMRTVLCRYSQWLFSLRLYFLFFNRRSQACIRRGLEITSSFDTGVWIWRRTMCTSVRRAYIDVRNEHYLTHELGFYRAGMKGSDNVKSNRHGLIY